MYRALALIALLCLCGPAVAGDILTAPVGINTSDPQAPLQIGSGESVYSVNPQLLLNEEFDGGSGSIHAFASNLTVHRSGSIGINSYDVRDRVIGTYNYDHFAGLQFNPEINTSGTTNDLFGLFSLPVVRNGTLTRSTHIHINDTGLSNGGSVGTQYGIYIAPLQNASVNWGIYSLAPSYFEGKFDVRGSSGELARFSTKTSTSAERWITVGAQDLDTEGFRLGYNGSTGNGWFACNYVTCKVEIKGNNGILLTGLRAAPSGSKALCFKDGEAYVASGSSCP